MPWVTEIICSGSFLRLCSGSDHVARVRRAQLATSLHVARVRRAQLATSLQCRRLRSLAPQEAEMEIGTSDRIRTCQRMLVHLLVSNCKFQQTWTRGKRQDRVQRTWTRGKGRTERKCAKRVFVRLFPSFIITSKEEWLLDYHSKRPGLKVLQQGIDDFIENHEAQAEKERKEREATAAAEGWTVVVHQKGRKKTVDSESGIPMGSVGLAAAEVKKAKKKAKESAVTFYRFQRREARRNEIMEL